MLLEHRLSALLQLYLHCRLNTWIQRIGQRQLQDNFKLQLQLQKALFDTNIHEHNNNIHVIMLCLETLIKVYTYRLHKSHRGRSDGIRVILSTIAYDQRNKTAFCMK